MKLIKDQGVSFILNACLAVLTLVSIIIYVFNIFFVIIFI